MSGVTDIRAYTELGTDFSPRFLARLSDNTIVLDNGSGVATLSGSSQGACLIPFRPSQSPQSWMYIAVAEDYQKLSAPDTSDVVLTALVGIQEPQQPPEAAPSHIAFDGPTEVSSFWTNAGVAGSPSNSDRTNDTAGKCIQDPVDPTNESRWSIQVSDDQYYQVATQLYIGAYFDTSTIIQDVLPPINQGAELEVDSIYYLSGSSGHCIVTPRQSPVSPTVPASVGNTPVASSLYSDPAMASLRRGALIKFISATDYHSEICLVLSVTRGPTGILSFETVTTQTYTSLDTIMGIPTIVVDHFNITTATEGEELISRVLDSTLSGVGTGQLSQTLASSPFTQIIDIDRGITPQSDDYITFAVKISDLTKFTSGRLIWNVGDTVDYTTDIFYADFTQEDILRLNPGLNRAFTPTLNDYLSTQGLSQEIFNSFSLERQTEIQAQYNYLYGNQTPPTSSTQFYPSNQWTVIQFPIRSLIRAGQNQSRSLSTCNAVRMEFTVTASITVAFTQITIGGGGQPDVGRFNSPYFYIVRGRSSITGAVSNPSPVSRYGVSPRRQQVRLQFVDFVNDPQMDLWDIYRYGGTVTSWRYLATIPNTSGMSATYVYTDDQFDTSIRLNPPAEYDNFQPWPTIDLPFDLSLFGSGNVFGTAVVLTLTTVPPNILRWLPGTLMVINNIAYTLWTRPTLVSGSTYLLRTVETIGSGVITSMVIYEPIVGNQHLPYVWGPDENGTVFAAGDPLRPGFVYFSKSNNPDSAPDKFNLEITPPSEPILGGEIIDGLCMVASSHRWWALYPNFGGSPRYQKVQRAIPRGLAAPYARCSDGKNIYICATDGIWIATDQSGKSLTDDDLRDLFPHEGVDGHDIVYAGKTIYAPDYKYAANFRLSFCKGYLYFDYLDSNATQRTLVLDTTKPKTPWVVDEYADPISVHYWLEGPQDNLTTPAAFSSVLVMGDSNGFVFLQVDRENDNHVPIDGVISTFEFNGGDVRADMLWGDAFLDSIPECGITVTPISDRVASGASTSITASTSRQRSVVKASGIEKKTLGILIEWTDDFDYVTTVPTKLFAWQPLHQPIPIKIYQWKTQGTNFGLQGYMHIPWIVAAYKSTQAVSLVITVYDGTSPSTITLPSTSGAYKKIQFPLSFNKGLLYFFQATSTEPWTPYFDAWEVPVGMWGRSQPYLLFTDIEHPRGIANSIAGPQPHTLG